MKALFTRYEVRIRAKMRTHHVFIKKLSKYAEKSRRGYGGKEGEKGTQKRHLQMQRQLSKPVKRKSKATIA